MSIHEHDPARIDPCLRLYNNRSEEKAQLIRSDGTVVHQWAHAQGRSWHYAEMIEDGHLIAIDKNHSIVELDRDSNLVWKFETPSHHDLARRSNGNTYVLSGRDRIDANMLPDRELYYDCCYEVTPAGDIAWSWFAEDHAAELGIDTPLPGDYGFGDWPHVNTCEILPDSPTAARDERFRAGNLLMCGRIIHTIWVVDRDTGAVVWHWGPGELIGPHMPTMLPNGNILIYDNGNLRGPARGYSRIVELEPLSGEVVWQYVADPPDAFYSPSRGSAERLPNGNHLIAESDSGRLFEVAPDGTVVWELRNDMKRADGRPDPIYRVKAYPPNALG